MRETVLDNNKKSIIVSELNDLYNKSSALFHAFMRDIVGSSLKCDMVFSYDSKCEDLTNKSNIDISHIFHKKYDLFIIDGKEKTNNFDYIQQSITFLINQNDMCPQIIICVSAEYFNAVKDYVNQIVKQITRSKDEYFIKVIDVYYLLYQLEQYKHNMGV